MCRYVERGGEIPIPEDALGSCVHSDVETAFKFDLGFDRKSVKSEDRPVSAVGLGSGAWKAGPPDGQKLIGWSFNFGDPAREVRLMVRTANGDHVLLHYPRGPGVSIQHLTSDLEHYVSQPNICTVGLGLP